MMKAVITEIGTQAINHSDAMIILFGENATEMLKKYSVIQRFETPEKQIIAAGDRIKIGEKMYTIDYVGSFANNNLASISHVTLVFSEVPEEDPIVNGIYLTPKELPELQVGTVIEYLTAGDA